MKFHISSTPLKTWTRAIHCIAKSGAEKCLIFLEKKEEQDDEETGGDIAEEKQDRVVLAACEAPPPSWFMRYQFKENFFVTLEKTDPDEVFEVRVKNLLQCFRNAANFERKDALCEVQCNSDDPKLKVTFSYKNGDIKRRFLLNFEMQEGVEDVRVKCMNHVVLHPKLFFDCLSQFHVDTTEIAVRINKNSVRMKTFRQKPVITGRSQPAQDLAHVASGETHFHIDVEDLNGIEIQESPVALISLAQLRPFVRLAMERQLLIYFFFEKGRPVKFVAKDDHISFSLTIDSVVTDPVGPFADMAEDTYNSESARKNKRAPNGSRSDQNRVNNQAGAPSPQQARTSTNNQPTTPIVARTARNLNDVESEQDIPGTPASLNRSRAPIVQQLTTIFHPTPNYGSAAQGTPVRQPAGQAATNPPSRILQNEDDFMTDEDSEPEDIDPDQLVSPPRGSQRSGTLSLISHCTVGAHRSPFRASSINSDELLARDSDEEEWEDFDYYQNE